MLLYLLNLLQLARDAAYADTVDRIFIFYWHANATSVWFGLYHNLRTMNVPEVWFGDWLPNITNPYLMQKTGEDWFLEGLYGSVSFSLKTKHQHLQFLIKQHHSKNQSNSDIYILQANHNPGPLLRFTNSLCYCL